MARKDWQNLNGLWTYKVTSKGKDQSSGKILVPYCIESSLSGVGHILQPHEVLWYERDFTVKKTDGRLLLHFEAVDYQCEAWVNDKSVGTHRGGNLPFSFDITGAASDGTNHLKLKVIDRTSGAQLRGKQNLRPRGIVYTRVSGIWQTVWLETVPATYIQRIKIDTKIDPATITLQTVAGGDAAKATAVEVVASFKGHEVARAKGTLKKTVLTVKDAELWSPKSPNLYDLKVSLLAGTRTVDTVTSFAGIREVGKQRDNQGRWRFTLNGKEIFHLGPLDQGWWPDSLLTPPTPEAMRYDIDFIKAAGFNMIRNHIKTRPRTYYHYCDKIGLLIWQDHVSGGKAPRWTRMRKDPKDAEWSDKDHDQFMDELKIMIDTYYNHPSIVVWVPFNEAWGQHRTVEVGTWTVAYDPSRLVNIASGGNFWPVGDIADHHSYPHPGFPLRDERFRDYICVVGEFGGHGFVVDKKHLWDPKARNWGYGGLPKTKDELVGRYRKSIDILRRLKTGGIAGGVYTQTSDIEGEVNGLLTYDREVAKISAEDLKRMHDSLYTVVRVKSEALPVAARNDKPVRYTTDKPKGDWMKPGFDDSGWKQGAPGLGKSGTPGGTVKTEWTTEAIWYRTTFDYDAGKGTFMLNACYDEDPVIYINGVKAATLSGYVTDYVPLSIAPEAMKALKATGNVLAVSCRNQLGGQYIDVGLVYTATE
jgi:beta-galactosidase